MHLTRIGPSIKAMALSTLDASLGQAPVTVNGLTKKDSTRKLGW